MPELVLDGVPAEPFREDPDEGSDGVDAAVGVTAGAGSALAVVVGADVATLTVGVSTGSGRAADACFARGVGLGLATIATGTAPAAGDPPLNPTGITARAADPSSAAGELTPGWRPELAVILPSAKKQAKTTSVDSSSAVQRPRTVAPGPPIESDSHRSRSASIASRIVLTRLGTESAWRRQAAGTRRCVPAACRAGSRSS